MYHSARPKPFGSDESLRIRAGLTAGIKPAALEPFAYANVRIGSQKLKPTWAPTTRALGMFPVPPGRMMYCTSGSKKKAPLRNLNV